MTKRQLQARIAELEELLQETQRYNQLKIDFIKATGKLEEYEQWILMREFKQN